MHCEIQSELLFFSFNTSIRNCLFKVRSQRVLLDGFCLFLVQGTKAVAVPSLKQLLLFPASAPLVCGKYAYVMISWKSTFI
jgi:hypothetical protein